jgi:hypothetical protein
LFAGSAVTAPWGSVLDRHPRWKGPVLVSGVSAVVVAIAWVAAYAPTPALAPVPSRGPPFVFGSAAPVMAVGSHSGPGGCAAPGGQSVEYCYSILVGWPMNLTGPFNLSGPAPVQYANTSVVAFTVQVVGTSGSEAFVNVTVLSPSGQLLAGYTLTGGWTAYPAVALPLVIVANDTVVLNLGPHPASDADLIATEGAWGTTGVSLP